MNQETNQEQHPDQSKPEGHQDLEPQETPEGPKEGADKASEAKAGAEELAEMKERWLRAVADHENFKKRMDRELQDMARYSISNFAKDLLTVADNLGRALQAVPKGEIEGNPLLKSLFEGVHMTESELLKAFEKHDVQKINPLKELFDHNYHQAIMEVEEASLKSGTVVDVLQPGYKIHDRLLRPAMVKVAK